MLSEQSSVRRILLAISVLPRGIVACIRVHFAKTQVQLRLDQKSSIPREYGISLPLAFSEGRRGRGKSRSDRGMERFVEGVVAKCTKQMTTGYLARAVEYLKDVACDIRIAMRDCSVYSGAFCEDTSATAPGSEI